MEYVKQFGVASTASMCAACVTNPIDVIKIRMQLEGELVQPIKVKKYNGFIRGLAVIVKEEGILSVQKGLSASVLREFFYSGLRVGTYDTMKEYFGASKPLAPLWKKILAGAACGVIGSGITTPLDLVKVQMQGDITGKRYKSTLSAFSCIYKERGIKGLYRGIGPNTQRAALLTASQIPAYDHFKHLIIKYQLMKEGFPLHCLSSMFAGFITAIVTSPSDVIKTRMMNQSKGTIEYKSTLDCAYKITKVEGILALYKGFFPNFARIGPHTIVTFIILEQLRKFVGIKPL